MRKTVQTLAQHCLQASYDGIKSFPEIAGILVENGFESYRIDYMCQRASYFMRDGACFDLPLPAYDVEVGAAFNAPAVIAAIKEAQENAAGYTYKSFCEKVMRAGCAGYYVSFTGKRVLYYGRTAETHVELFPDAKT